MKGMERDGENLKPNLRAHGKEKIEKSRNYSSLLGKS
jgi:hypothetical protein